MSGGAPEGLAGTKAASANPVLRYLARFDEGEVLKWAFRGLLAGAIGVLANDLVELHARAPASESILPADLPGALPDTVEPILPPAVEGDGEANGTTDPRDDVTTEADVLRQAATVSLGKGGVLALTGTIDPAAAERLRAELDARGEYVKTVALNSPGGSLEAALALSTLIRERGLSTEVADGALCASSCPLILAGGTDRQVAEKAAVGLHQFYAMRVEGLQPAQALSDAQATTARITRHLETMGVDPALWLHALDTPPRRLYYLSPAELAKYRLSTGAPDPVAAAGN